MIRGIIYWVEHRTSLRSVMDALLLEHIPGGARWRYVWGSCLSFVFALQVLTGILLMTAYSPNAGGAWGSVYFIQYEMDFGWLIRGLHHFGSQTMVVLLFVHMLQVVIAGAHLPPREFNWWIGLGLLGIVLGLSLTGYLLPWDMKGFYATQVATNIMSTVPGIGDWLQQIVIGGSSYGTPTLTRFFAMHVAILPALLIVLLVAHLALFRRHGITYPGYPKKVDGPGAWFWPEQVFRDVVACIAVLGVMLFLVFNGHGHPVTPHGAETAAADSGEEDLYAHWAKAGQRGLGANLDAPAAPTSYEARPEWYFLFLFQLLKYFEGEGVSIIGSQVIPGAVALVLFLLPFFGFGRMRPFGHMLGVVAVIALVAAMLTLTCEALAHDTPDPVAHALLHRVAFKIIPAVAGFWLIHLALAAIIPSGALRVLVVPLMLAILTALMVGTGTLVYAALSDQVPDKVAELVREKMQEEELATPASKAEFEKALKKAAEFQKKVVQGSILATRAIELAGGGIPAEGANVLLERDPKTQFKPLFMSKCAACHSYADAEVVQFTDPKGFQPLFKIRDDKAFAKAKFTASDLAGYGTEEWIFSFLKNPMDNRFFGRIVDENGDHHLVGMRKVIKRAYADAKNAGPDGVVKLEKDFRKIAAFLATHPTGTDFKEPAEKEGFKLFKEKYECVSCHGYAGVNNAGTAPDMTGYASAPWLHKMIRSPGHPEMYAGRNFLEVDKNGKKISKNLMPSFLPAGNTLADLQRKDYQFFLIKTLEIHNVDFADLSDLHRELIVRGLTGDYRLVFGGQEITAAKEQKKEK